MKHSPFLLSAWETWVRGHNINCLYYTVFIIYSTPPLSIGGPFQTLKESLKLQIVPNHLYPVFSYTHTPMIKFNV